MANGSDLLGTGDGQVSYWLSSHPTLLAVTKVLAVVTGHVARADLRRAPHIVMVPTVVIFLTVLALNYLGDVVRARFDVRESAL